VSSESGTERRSVEINVAGVKIVQEQEGGLRGSPKVPGAQGS